MTEQCRREEAARTVEESEVPASEDLKRRSSVFSFPPLFTFTSFSPHLLHHYLGSALPSSPQYRTGRSVSGASRDLPRGPQMGCQVQGLDRSGNKRPPPLKKKEKKNTMKGLDLGKNVFNSLPIDGCCIYGMCSRVSVRRFPGVLGSPVVVRNSCICVEERSRSPA